MKFEVGNVLSRAIQITLSKFFPLVGIALVIYAPAIVLIALLTLGGGGETSTVTLEGGQQLEIPRVNVMGMAIASLIAVLAGFVMTAALVHAVFQVLRGRPIVFQESIGEGFKRAFPVLGVSILVGIVVGLGFLLFIVPGFILVCVLFVAVPAVVVERGGVFDAMSRSAALTQGKRGAIFAIVLVFMGIGLVVSVLTQDFARSGLVGLIVAQLVGMVISLFNSVSQVVAYHDLRVEKEGIGTEEIAAVFD